MTDLVFRSSSAFELIVFDRLPPRERNLLCELERNADLFGVLRPRTPTGTLKAVSRDTALLLFTLQQEGPLPAFASTDAGSECLPHIGELVVDGVLEVRQGSEYVSGPRALPLLGLPRGGGPSDNTSADGLLAQLSRAALQYGERLDLGDPLRLSARLYFYNRLPLSPRWQRLYRDVRAVREALGIAAGQPLSRRLARDYRSQAGQAENGWLTWHRRGAEAAPWSDHVTFKLYVSPQPEALAPTFEAVCDLRPDHFKVGADAAGLLRPDKLVMYFGDFESLTHTARRLAELLNGVPAHGVPFTAPASKNGLLSWGVDPPPSEQLLSWRQRESWRLWLTNRLAAALISSCAQAPSELPPWRFALERLRCQGVDTERWVPDARLWPESSCMEAPWTSNLA